MKAFITFMFLATVPAWAASELDQNDRVSINQLAKDNAPTALVEIEHNNGKVELFKLPSGVDAKDANWIEKVATTSTPLKTKDIKDRELDNERSAESSYYWGYYRYNSWYYCYNYHYRYWNYNNYYYWPRDHRRYRRYRVYYPYWH